MATREKRKYLKVNSIKSKMMSVTINTRGMKSVQACVCEATACAIRACATEYKFDAEEAITRFGMVTVVDGKSKKAAKKAAKVSVLKPSMCLPFCGSAIEGLCCGVKLNRGLYTQCMMMPVGETQFCTTCTRQAAQNESGKPNYGTIQERIEKGAEWKDPKGKAPVNYGNVMLKMDIKKEDAIAEAAKFGWEIAEEQFEVVKAKKGRPAKAKEPKDPNAPAKKRGRPKKTKAVVATGNTGDDIIANLVAQAQGAVAEEIPVAEVEVAEEAAEVKPKKTRKPKMTAEEKEAAKLAKAEAKAAEKAAKAAAKEAEKAAKAEAKKAEKAAKAAAKKAEKEAAKLAKAEAKKAEAAPVEEEEEVTVEDIQQQVAELEIEDFTGDDEEDEEDEVEVEKFEHDGIVYLKDGEGTVYDMESQDAIGTWDGEKIVLLSGVESDEDEE